VNGAPGHGPASAPAVVPSLNATITLLAFAVAVVVTTEFIVVGLVPMIARDLGISVPESGRLVTWFALSSAVLGPLLTIGAGKVRPRPVLVLALLVFGLGNLMAATIPSHPVLVAVRVVQGAALPVVVSVGSAAIAHIAGPGRDGRALALVNVGVVVGAVLAMPSGVLLADHAGWSASFIGLTILALIAAAALQAAFPRLERAEVSSIKAQATILGGRSFQAHLLLSAALFTAMFSAYTYLAAFLEVVAGFDGRRVAFALTGFGTAGLLGNWIAGRMVGRGPTAATAGAALTLAVVMPALSLVGGKLSLLMPLLAVWGATHAAAFVLCQVRVMRAGASAPAFAASLNISVCNLGIALGAVAGGAIVQRYGIEAIGFGSGAFAACALSIACLTLAATARGTTGRSPDLRSLPKHLPEWIRGSR
jgi:DHA1 family inner membrane transport protein